MKRKSIEECEIGDWVSERDLPSKPDPKYAIIKCAVFERDAPPADGPAFEKPYPINDRIFQKYRHTEFGVCWIRVK